MTLIVAVAAATPLLVSAPAGAKGKIKVAQQNFTLSSPNNPERLEVECKKGTRPLGGGLFGSPPVGADGVGIYPTSSERLGVQEGWHDTATLFDEIGGAAPRTATLQAFCAKLKGEVTPVQTTELISPGQSISMVATCPRGQKVISGGHLSTQFFPGKGVYATESRRLTPSSWIATGFGVPTGKGGSMTALAYCIAGKKQFLSERQGTASVPAGGVATATTPPCPGSKPLAVGGFGGPTTGAARFFDPRATPGGAWSVSAHGLPALGGGPITAYGYCVLSLKSSNAGGKFKKPEATTVPTLDSSFVEPASPHGPSFTITVNGSSFGKLRGTQSNSPIVTRCLADRHVLISTSYQSASGQAGSAGPDVETRSDASGNFTAQMPIALPAGLQDVALSVSPRFDQNVNRKVNGKRVGCQPGGLLRPDVQSIGP